MENRKLEDLLVEAAESDTAEIISLLEKKLSGIEDIAQGDIPANIEFMLENWSDAMTEPRARFCIALAEKGMTDTPVVRKAVGDAVRMLLPPFLGGTGFLRALGLRDNSLPLAVIARRYHNLMRLKNEVVLFLPTSSLWVKITSIDSFTSSVAVAGIKGGGAYAIPLEIILSSAFPFAPGPDTLSLVLVDKKQPLTAAKYCEIARKNSLLPLDDEAIKSIAAPSLVPSIFTAYEFGRWWESAMVEEQSGSGSRGVGDARSIHELHVLAGELETQEGGKITQAEAVKLKTFFARMRPPHSLNENVMLAEAISLIAPFLDDETFASILAPLRNKAVFWPEKIEGINLEQLEMWGKIPAKCLPEITRATGLLFDAEYVAAYSTHLPLRCLNVFCAFADDAHLEEAIRSKRDFTSDILLWIWRNRKTHSKSLLSMVNIGNVIRAIARENLPKAWGSAQRDLKAQLIDKQDFQQLMIENAGDNVASITMSLQNGACFQKGEQQSLLVKLSRLSPELRELLEQGEAAKIFAGRKSDTDDVPADNRPLITSLRSYKRLVQELKDIDSIHVPENRESLKTARAHGDFRENAEYDAAKQRRNFLSGRKAELEQSISAVQATDFKNVVLDGRVVVGCEVELKNSDGDPKRYFVVGAYDGDPDNHRISYRTRFGQCLMDKKTGDKIVLPDGTECKLNNILPLPEKIRLQLADEA